MHKWLGLVGMLPLVLASGCGATPPEAEALLPDEMDIPTDPPPDNSDPKDVAARVTVTPVDSKLLDIYDAMADLRNLIVEDRTL